MNSENKEKIDFILEECDEAISNHIWCGRRPKVDFGVPLIIDDGKLSIFGIKGLRFRFIVDDDGETIILYRFDAIKIKQTIERYMLEFELSP